MFCFVFETMNCIFRRKSQGEKRTDAYKCFRIKATMIFSITQECHSLPRQLLTESPDLIRRILIFDIFANSLLIFGRNSPILTTMRVFFSGVIHIIHIIHMINPHTHTPIPVLLIMNL